jgi:hypothetical protein
LTLLHYWRRSLPFSFRLLLLLFLFSPAWCPRLSLFVAVRDLRPCILASSDAAPLQLAHLRTDILEWIARHPYYSGIKLKRKRSWIDSTAFRNIILWLYCNWRETKTDVDSESPTGQQNNSSESTDSHTVTCRL